MTNSLMISFLLHGLFTLPIEPIAGLLPSMVAVLSDDQLFREHYVLTTSDNTQIRGHEIKMQLYALGDETPASGERSDLADRVTRISTDSGGVIQWPMEGHSDLIEWYVPNTAEPLLGMEDSNGGNCFNCEFLHIVSLSDWSQPTMAGKATDISDENGDGWDDLMTNEDLLEVFYFSHAESSSIKVFWQVIGGVLVLSVEPYRAYYEDLLTTTEAGIRGFEALGSEDTADEKDGEMGLIFQEFLIRRIISPDTARGALHERLNGVDDKMPNQEGQSIEAGILERLDP